MNAEHPQHTFGVGNGTTSACVNSLAYLLYAEQQGISREKALRTLTDNVSCVCPVIRRLSMRINDARYLWPDHDEATRWMHETAPRLLGSKASLDVRRKRAFLCADAAIREIAPIGFDAVANRWPQAREWAEKLRACEPVVDVRTARSAQHVAQNARKAAYAGAAYAAGAGADAAAYAAYAAYADAADADADAAAAAYAAIIKPIMLALLERCLAVEDNN